MSALPLNCALQFENRKQGGDAGDYVGQDDSWSGNGFGLKSSEDEDSGADHSTHTEPHEVPQSKSHLHLVIAPSLHFQLGRIEWPIGPTLERFFGLTWEELELLISSGELAIYRNGQRYWTSGLLSYQNFPNMPILNDPNSAFHYNLLPVSNKEEKYLTYFVYDEPLLMWKLEPEGYIVDSSSLFITLYLFCYGYQSSSYDGCVSHFGLPSCRSRKDTFMQKQARFEGNIVSQRDGNSGLSISDYMEKCWNNCSCVGFTTSNSNSNVFSGLMDQVVAENGVQQVELLFAVNDDHGGVIVEMKEPMDSKAFLSLLRASISQWKQQGKNGVWIKLPIGLVNLVETAVKDLRYGAIVLLLKPEPMSFHEPNKKKLVREGFRYHHAEPHYLMLVYWIPEAASTVPANATHRVGVGAIVMNDKREEKSGRLQGKGIWKIPTGVVDEGEDIFAAAVREVKEETNIDTEFVEILAFRFWMNSVQLHSISKCLIRPFEQFHKVFFEKSDLSFLCILSPLSFDIQKQELEIEAAQWMPFEEYAAQPITQKHGLFKYISEICLAKVDREYVGFSPLPMTSSFDDQVTYIYLNNHDLNQ
ncbi:unnamed protein product [Camellia sinensis]